MPARPLFSPRALNRLQSLHCPRTGQLQPCLPAFLLGDSFVDSRRQLTAHRPHKLNFPRLASTTPKDPNTKSRASVARVVQINPKINPLASTIPAPLLIPEQQHGQSKFRYYLACGKAYWNFYKTGVKNIMENRRIANRLKQGIKRNSLAYAAKTGRSTAEARRAMLGATRAQRQLIIRSRSELARVPIFALLLVVFGEWLPLLVIFMTPLIPFNCRIPKQVDKWLLKRQRQRIKARHELRSITRQHASCCGRRYSRSGPVPGPTSYTPFLVWEVFNLGSKFDAFTRGALTFYSPILRHLNYLVGDTAALLAHEPDPQKVVYSMSDAEVRIAAEERTIDILNRPVDQVRDDLALWLELVKPSLQGKQSSVKWYISLMKSSSRIPSSWQKTIKPQSVMLILAASV